MMKVEQMINNRGNGAMNQFIIRDDENNKMVFQSYDSMIVEMDYNTNTITLGKNWDYSTTTGKHRNIFFMDYAYLPELASKKELEKYIKIGAVGNWTIKTA